MADSLKAVGTFGALMRGAVLEYEAITGEKLSSNPLLHAETLDDVLSYTESKITQFKDFRHKDGKWDTIRTKLASALEPVATISTALGAALGNAYPPCAAVFTAINFVVSAASRVRDGFDNLLGFLEDVGTYLQDLSILDDDMPEYRAPQIETKVKQIFAAMLILCGISSLYIKQGRFGRGLRMAFTDKDTNLSKAYLRLEKAVKDLNVVVGYNVHKNVSSVRGELVPLREDVKFLRKNAEENVPPQRRVNDFFGHHAGGDPAFQERKKNIVPGTALAILKERAYIKWSNVEWSDQASPFLWVYGGPGTGKSYVAYTAIADLLAKSEEYRKISVGIYFFPVKSTRAGDQTLKTALSSIITQAVERDAIYGKAIVTTLSNSSSTLDQMKAQNVWQDFIKSQYGTASTRKLFLTFVGVDKMEEHDQETLHTILEDISSEKLNIRVLVVSQASKHALYGQVQDIDIPKIEIIVDDIGHDLSLYIKSQVQKSRKLRKLSPSLKKKIISKLKHNYGGFGLATLQLEELEKVDEPEDVPDVLKNLPPSYKAALEETLDKISRNIKKKEEIKAYKTLLSWVAQEYTPFFSISQLRVIIGLKTTYQSFNIRENVNTTFASLLDVIDFDDESDSDSSTNDSEAGDNDENEGGEKQEDGCSGSDASENDSGDNSGSGSSSGSGDNSSSNESDDEEPNDNDTISFRTWAYADIFSIDYEWCEKLSKTSDLVEHLSIARFDICVTLMGILVMSPSHKDYERTRILEKYAAINWMDHFLEMDVRDVKVESRAVEDFPTQSQISTMTESLHDIFASPESAKANERWENETYWYFLPESRHAEHTQGWEKLLGWLKLYKSPSVGRLSVEIVSWLNTILQSPAELLKPLAKEHVIHWFAEIDTPKAIQIYTCAKHALESSGLILGSEAKYESVVKVAEYFTDLEKSDNANRSIGRLLKDAPQHAFEYLEVSLSQATTDLSRFYTYTDLADVQYDSGQYKAAVISAQMACKLDSDGLFCTVDTESQNLYRKSLYLALRILGDSLFPHPPESMESDEQGSIEAYTKARSVIIASEYELDDGDSGVYTLLRVISIEGEQMAWAAVVSLIKNWSAIDCGHWIVESAKYQSDQNATFRRAAQLTGQLDVMRQCYMDAIATNEEENNEDIIRYQLARAYFEVMQDDDAAYSMLREIFTGDISGDDTEAKSGALLLEIVNNQIQISQEQWLKRLLLKEMETIFPVDSENATDLYTIVPRLQLAGAYLDTGNNVLAKKYLGIAFETCLEALRDSIRGNDRQALRILARVLSMAAFERDSLIAISCQFSIVDFEPPIETTDEAVQSGDHSDVGEEVVKETGSAQLDPIRMATTNNEMPDEIITLEAPVIATDHKTDSYFDKISKREDLNEKPSVFCNGPCQSEMRYWPPDGAIFMCLICPDVDLTQECYDKRMAQNLGEKNEHWMRVCGMNHIYLKGPIADWRGVKNGVMSIGEDKIPFINWLAEIEGKWKIWIDRGVVNEEKVEAAGTS